MNLARFRAEVGALDSALIKLCTCRIGVYSSQSDIDRSISLFTLRRCAYVGYQAAKGDGGKRCNQAN
jgi:hypothetical protein